MTSEKELIETKTVLNNFEIFTKKTVVDCLMYLISKVKVVSESLRKTNNRKDLNNEMVKFKKCFPDRPFYGPSKLQ